MQYISYGDMEKHHYLVPEHTQGTKKDFSYVIVLADTDEASDLFVDAKDVLLNINDWNKLCTGIRFTLSDHYGTPVKRNAKRGDYIIANIPANDAILKAEIDWIYIDSIEYDDYPDIDTESFAMHMHLSKSPMLKDVPEQTTDLIKASSTFVVERIGKRMSATYHGRNNIAATADEEASATLLRTVQWFSLPDTVWKDIIKGFLVGIRD